MTHEKLVPTSEAETAEIVAAARKDFLTLAIEGGGTRKRLGRPAESKAILSTAALTGITLHEPAELVISARAGTPLAEVEQALRDKGQGLPFEPMDHRLLYGSTGAPTIGAVAACNLSGPRRIAAGAARDALIGLRLVNGRGEVVKSGGRVMKNVTGLDLVKLVSGAHGTLGILTEVTFRVLPLAERQATLVFHGLDDAAAVAALSRALGSPYSVTGAAHLPAGIGAPKARTLVRIEGFARSVDHRLGALKALLADCGAPDIFAGADGEEVWRDVRDVRAFAKPAETDVWRVSVAPGNGPKLVDAIGLPGARHFYDWGGGLVWLQCDKAGAAVRAAVKIFGGHATLVRGAALTTADVFQPLDAPLMALTARIKAAFDPDHILNPGRMYPDANH